jgi:hypothetical protein
MAGQGKASLVRDKYKVLSTNSNTAAGWTYHITTAATITLPDTTTLIIGDKVTFTKRLDVIPVIQRSGATVLIKTRLGLDSSVFFDVNAEITFVWNGVEWEV